MAMQRDLPPCCAPRVHTRVPRPPAVPSLEICVREDAVTRPDELRDAVQMLWSRQLERATLREGELLDTAAVERLSKSIHHIRVCDLDDAVGKFRTNKWAHPVENTSDMWWEKWVGGGGGGGGQCVRLPCETCLCEIVRSVFLQMEPCISTCTRYTMRSLQRRLLREVTPYPYSYPFPCPDPFLTLIPFYTLR